MKELFELFLYQPVFNIFVGIYNVIPDVGIVILIITILLKVVTYPLTSSSLKAQKSLTDLQPKMADLKEKYKGDQQKIAQETMLLYKEHKVNPLGSCLPILVQLPIFLALYWVLRGVFAGDDFHLLYSFVGSPGHINPISLGLVDLGKSQFILALLAGAAQFWQAKLMYKKRAPSEAGKGAKDENMMAMMNKQMLYFMPFFTFLISLSFPGGLALYWFLSTLITALQHVFLFRNKDKKGGGSGDVIEGTVVS